MALQWGRRCMHCNGTTEGVGSVPYLCSNCGDPASLTKWMEDDLNARFRAVWDSYEGDLEMMLTKESIVGEFHEAMDSTPEMYKDLIALRMKLIKEEAAEVCDALTDLVLYNNGDLEGHRRREEHLLKELCDLQYVLSGTVYDLGWTSVFSPAFNRVHKSNMSKLGVDGKPIKRKDGKVLKGPNYAPPYLEDLIDEHK